MKLCFVDESGGSEPFGSDPKGSTPLMAFAGVIVDASQVARLTHGYLDLKVRFFPGKMAAAPQTLDRVLIEVKGSEVRRSVAAPNRDRRRQALLFLGGVIDLLETVDARLVGRIWVKAAGQGLIPRSTYTFAAQDIAAHTQNLVGTNDQAVMVFDARMANQNVEVTHSLFTQKFKSIGGDAYPSLIDVPVFGHSTSHVGIQVADLVASALLFPMATTAYCATLGPSPHIDLKFSKLTELFGERLKNLQHRYQDSNGKWRGGVVVSDALNHRPGGLLFEPTTAAN